jgi:fatty-acyl-CoA synthase
MLHQTPWPVPAPLPALPADSFDALLARMAMRRPESPVLSWCDPASDPLASAWTHVSGTQLQRRVNAAAALLKRQHHVQPGDRVAWLGLNHPAQIVLLWALARLQAVFVPLNHRLSPQEWAAVMDDCTPTVLVCDETLQSLGASKRCSVP